MFIIYENTAQNNQKKKRKINKSLNALWDFGNFAPIFTAPLHFLQYFCYSLIPNIFQLIFKNLLIRDLCLHVCI